MEQRGIYIYIYVCVCVCVCIYIYIYVCVCVCVTTNTCFGFYNKMKMKSLKLRINYEYKAFIFHTGKIKTQYCELLYSVLHTNIVSQYVPATSNPILTAVKYKPAIYSYGFETSHFCLVFQL